MHQLRKSFLSLVAICAAIGFPSFLLADSEPPLPDGLVIVAPDASIPAEFAEFVGLWKGNSNSGPTAFVVTNMTAKGKASCIYAWNFGGEVGATSAVDCSVKRGILTVRYPYGKNNSANLAAAVKDSQLNFTYFTGKSPLETWILSKR